MRKIRQLPSLHARVLLFHRFRDSKFTVPSFQGFLVQCSILSVFPNLLFHRFRVSQFNVPSFQSFQVYCSIVSGIPSLMFHCFRDSKFTVLSFQGFQALVEREWLDFGHKFADRCGQGVHCDDSNERCPVFLQFLDCVHQLMYQFPCAFEYNETFLVSDPYITYT